MKRIITALALIAATAQAEIVWTVQSNPTNAATAVTGSARAFRGELDRIHVYVPANHTGTVTVVMVDPYGGPSSLVATNADTVAHHVFVPRTTPTLTAGAAGLNVTNTGERITFSGESLLATISDVSNTNIIIRFRAVLKD